MSNDPSDRRTQQGDAPFWPVPALVAFFTLSIAAFLGYFRHCGDTMNLCEPPLYMTKAKIVPVKWWLVAIIGLVGVLSLVYAVGHYWIGTEIERTVPREEQS